MKLRSGNLLSVALSLLSSVAIAGGSGVTLITHGYAGDVSGWITGMASQIPNYPTFTGTAHTTYQLTITFDGSSYFYQYTMLEGAFPTNSDSAEIIIKLDWSQVAGGASAPYDESTYDVARAVAWALEQNEPLLSGHSPAEFPLHLIGHSRGGSLVTEISRLLGADGIWVDHLTTLDPHPFNNDGNVDLLFPTDASARNTYINVLFRDNYWQNIGVLTDPDGEPVLGAYNRQLTDLEGGYNNTSLLSPYHSNVHLWYHATIDRRNPADDTEAQVTDTEFSTWYVASEQAGIAAGYRWSRIGGGDRTSPIQPVGPGHPAIRDGYNQAWDIGAGQSANRQALQNNNGSWPNIVRLDVLGTNVVVPGTPVSIKYFFQYGQSSSQTASVQIFLDTDSNPFNGSSAQIFTNLEAGTGTNNLMWRSFPFNPTNIAPGQYHLYAKVTGGVHTRYMQAPGTLTVLPSPDLIPPTVSITNPPTGKTYTNSQTLSISATATDNVGVAKVEFYDGTALKATGAAPPYNYDWSFTATDNGTHFWTARAYDAAQNVSTSAVVTAIVRIDVTPPSIAITKPSNGTNLTTATTTVSGTASDPGSPSSGLSTVEVRVNGGAWQTASGTASWSKSVTVTPCLNSIEARSRDKAGNYSQIASNFVSYIPPNTAPKTPTNTSPASGALNLTVTPLLQASPFTDLDCVGDTHAASEWQVMTTAGKIVADSGTDTVHKVSWTVPTTKLAYGSNYQWHVRYRDSRNAWSAYSTNTTFATGGPQLIATKTGTNIVFKWPTNAPGFMLQWSTNLNLGAFWSNVTPAPVIVSGNYTVTNSITNRFQAYRLKK